jgi:hypothetical protein
MVRRWAGAFPLVWELGEGLVWEMAGETARMELIARARRDRERPTMDVLYFAKGERLLLSVWKDWSRVNALVLLVTNASATNSSRQIYFG